MALTFGGKLNISGNITLSTYTAVLAGPVIEYVMGNSASFNGQGIDLGHNDFTNAPSASVNLIMDLSADYANGEIGNYGYFYGQNNDDITGGDFVNNGPLSYLRFTGDGAGNGHDVSSEQANGPDIPGGSSYTIFSVVRVNNFGDPTNPYTWTGGIVGGDQSGFGFVPAGTAGSPPTNYPFLYASNTLLSGPDSVFDFDTQFQPNTWYAVAVTYNADSQTMKLYVNGVNTGTSTSVAPFSNDEPLYWGTWEGSNWLNGDLAVMTVWTRALSPTEITNYTNTYGGPYGVANAVQNNSMPTQTYSQLFNAPGTYGFTVPAGVTSISTVAVGAGGGGTWGAYSPPGGDSYIYSQWDNVNTAMVTNAGYSDTFITFDCTDGNNGLILGNVAAGWLVTSSDINNTYPNRALIEGNAYGVVTNVDSTDTANVVVHLNISVSSGTASDYYFLGQAIVGAQGALEINDSSYYTNDNGTPGPRAVPLIGDGGGMGGVVDSLSSWPIGGAGAGGYGTNANVVAFDINQSYIYNGDGDSDIGVANITLDITNDNLTVASTANIVDPEYSIATGTYAITNGSKVMFSIYLDLADTNAGAWQGFGVGDYNANIANYVGGTTSAGFYNDGSFYVNGVNAESGYPTFTTEDTVDLAVDNDNKLLWYRVNGGDWMGDPAANPATGVNGVSYASYMADQIYLMISPGNATNPGIMSINTSNVYTIPAGYSFIAGSANAGSTGGDGTNQQVPTNRPGTGDGTTGGSGGGGGGIYDDIGSGGGGVGLYGVGNPGTAGGWVDGNTYNANEWIAQALGGGGGSRRGNSGTRGGMASSWAGGAGGWPGGGGGSGTSLWDGGNGGALAYRNNISVTPGHNYYVIVGQGGWGGGTGNETYYSAGVGGAGAVRIVWPGDTRQFPDTNVGIDTTGPSSVTVGTSDFTMSNNNGIIGNISGGHVVSLSTSGNSNIIDRFVTLRGLTNNSLATQLTALYTQAGMTCFNPLNYSGASYQPYNFNAYIFNVTWADSSTGKVRMSWDGLDGDLTLSIIDTAYTDWQTANPLNTGNPNPVLAGTFAFPATFTPYTPLIESNGNAWC